MKVLLIHEHGRSFGSGGLMAMYRLHRGLQKAGVDSTIACRKRAIDEPDFVELPRSDRWEGLISAVTWRLGFNDLHCVSSFKITKFQPFVQADVVNSHGLHTNFFNYLALPRLVKIKPWVATMHDMWHITGHCGFAMGCPRWKTGCGKCPDLNIFPPVSRDSTAIDWRLKNRVYRKIENTGGMHVVAPSQWLFDQVQQSMLNRFPIHLIRHAVDTDVYRPPPQMDKRACREALGIPADKLVVMFAANALSDRVKGGDLFVETIKRLPADLKSKVMLLLLGDRGQEIAEACGMATQAKCLGYLREDQPKVQAYSAADVFVIPSRFEVQGLVALEALACGTPVAGFAVGGIPEAVRPNISGVLAEPENADDLCNAIVKLLSDASLRQRLGTGGRALIEAEFSLAKHVQQYIDVYEQAIADRRPKESRARHLSARPLTPQ